MPLIVSGRVAFEYAAKVGWYRSTNGTFFAAATSAIAAVYRAMFLLAATPSGRRADLWSSKAIGENSTSFGADVPLYFGAAVAARKASRSARNFGNPAAPAHDSLYP